MFVFFVESYQLFLPIREREREQKLQGIFFNIYYEILENGDEILF
jgi:hypothetical protein